MTHVLYRCYSDNGRLLYVGRTINPGQRLTDHAGYKFWWGDVATIDLEHFETRAELVAAERKAIEAEGPVFNVIHNNGGLALEWVS